MKNNLRRLAILLSAALIFSFALPVSAKGESGDFEKHITVLNKLGIAEKPYSLSYSEEAMTREEFVVSVMKMQKVSAAADGRRLFFDVDPEGDNAGYINAAYDMGFISGMGSGLFGGAEEITLSEAVSVLIKSIGYSVRADVCGGYPTGYLTTAKALKITDGVKNTGYLTKGESFCLMFNAMNTPFSDTDSVNGEYDFSRTDGKTVFSAYYDVYYTGGKIMKNRYVSLPAGDGLSKYGVYINGLTLYSGTTKADDFLGFDCDVWYAEENGENEVLYIEKTSINESVLLDLKDVKEFNTDKITYYNKRDKVETATLVPAFSAVINNEIFKVTEKVNLPDMGDMEIIDSDGDGSYETVVIRGYENFYASSVDNKANIIYNLKDTADNLRFEDYDNVEIKNSEGAELTIGGISDSVFFNIRRNSKKTYLEIIKTGTLENVLIKQIKSTSDGEYEITDGDGNKHTVSAAVEKNQPEITIELGKVYSFGLDVKGRICYIFKSSDQNTSYGYLMNIAIPSKGLDAVPKFKLLTEDNGIKTFELRDKVLTDGGSKNSVDFAKAVSAQILITYGLDSEGKISEVYFAKSYPQGDEEVQGFHVCGSSFSSNEKGSNDRYSSSTKLIGGQILVDSNTVIFNVGTDVNNEFDFYVDSMSQLKNDLYYSNATGYTRKSDSMCAEVVVIPASEITLDESSPIFVFDSFGESYDAKTKEKTEVIRGWSGGEYVDLTLQDNVNFEYNDTDGKMYSQKAAAASVNPITPERGDVLRIAKNSNNEISAFKVIFSRVLEKAYEVNKGFAEKERYDYGIPAYRNGNTFRMILNGTLTTDIYVPISTTAIYEYDSGMAESKRLRTVTLNDIEMYNGANGVSSKAFVAIFKTQPQVIVIYK